MKVYCVTQELERCKEELRFLPRDAINTLHYFSYQQSLIAAAVAAARKGQQEASTPAEAALCSGRVYALTAWQARIAGMQRSAAAAFQKAGWIVAG